MNNKSIYELRLLNTLDPMIPEWWAQEGLVRLEKALVTSQLCNRDYQNEFQSAGDVVNVHRVGEFNTDKKQPGEEIDIQDASSEADQVKLNLHLYNSFALEDVERQKGFPNLVERFLAPAVYSIARTLDQYVGMESYRFLDTVGGKINKTVDYDDLVDVNTRMLANKAPDEGRYVVLGPSAKGDLLKTGKLTEYRMTGDGSPILNGYIGEASGLSLLYSQNVPSVPKSADTETEAVDGAHGPGATEITVSTLGEPVKKGQWLLIAGDNTPQQCTEDTASPSTTLKITPGLRYDVEDGAEITVFSAGGVDYASGYAVGYDGPIKYDTFTQAPHVGQGVTFGDSTHVYGVWKVDTSENEIYLSQPLAEAVSDDDEINPLPWGTYNIAMRSPAITLVNRPMDIPMGANGAYAQYNDLSLRVLISYDHKRMRNIVTVDSLFGLKTLDTAQGAVLLS